MGENKDMFKKENLFEENYRNETLENVTYPYPIEHRPTKGARKLILRQFGRTIRVIMSELTNWKCNCRVKAAKLLQNMIIYSEHKFVNQIEFVIQGIHKALLMRDPKVNKTLLETLPWIGLFINPEIWWQYFANLSFHDYDEELFLILKG